MLRPLRTDLPEEFHIGWPGRPGLLVALDLVGRGNEVLRKLLDVRIGPDKLPVENSVVSGTAQRMAVHRPEENRLILRACLSPGLAKCGAPTDPLPGQLALLGYDVPVPGIQGLFRKRLAKGRQGRHEDACQHIGTFHRSSSCEAIADTLPGRPLTSTRTDMRADKIAVGADPGHSVIDKRSVYKLSTRQPSCDLRSG